VRYLTDGRRHLICEPYSRENLHAMAEDLRIDRGWFHAGSLAHYDIPKTRKMEIEKKCTLVSPKDIVRIIRSVTRVP
jgi:hypothetical protein